MVDVSSSRRGRVPPRTQAAPRRHELPWTGPIFAAALAGLGLASCSTTSTTPVSTSTSSGYFDAFKSKPTTTLMLIESNPGGAQAKTSFGKACTTPCTMLIGESSDFTVTFTMPGYVSQTVTVHATMNSGGWTTTPSPVFDPPSLFPTRRSRANRESHTRSAVGWAKAARALHFYTA
jgi:hypothetical protein